VSLCAASATRAQRDVYEVLRAFILSLGDDVSERPLKPYIAFRRIRNFATVCVQKKK
jgi:predicted transport protein